MWYDIGMCIRVIYEIEFFRLQLFKLLGIRTRTKNQKEKKTDRCFDYVFE